MPNRSDARTAAVVGGSGFVGSAVAGALEAAGATVLRLSAPRLTSDGEGPASLVGEAMASTAEIAALAAAIGAADVVVNAAGMADAVSDQAAAMLGANALLPRVVREAAVAAGADRFVHISSAAVQGRRDPIDETLAVEPFSLYTRSKAWGEQTLADCPETVIFRPTSVHGVERSVSRSVAKLARSPLASVAGDGSSPTPQVLVENVGSAVAFVALHEGTVPPIVLQPWEGLTTATLIEVLGGRRARRIPMTMARGLVSALRRAPAAKVAANVRRLEMLWFGQGQVDGWLSTSDWRAPSGISQWQALAEAMKAEATSDSSRR
jgi:nucleoside-diphosphate-sugar epimerase